MNKYVEPNDRSAARISRQLGVQGIREVKSNLDRISRPIQMISTMNGMQPGWCFRGEAGDDVEEWINEAEKCARYQHKPREVVSMLSYFLQDDAKYAFDMHVSFKNEDTESHPESISSMEKKLNTQAKELARRVR